MMPGLDDLESLAGGRIRAGTVDQVGHIVINNPERLNAIGLDMWEAATEAAEKMADDPDVRLMILSGAGGKAFASGADISKFETERATKRDVLHYQATSSRFYDALGNFPKPTIALIRGYCIGGGLALAICCDLRICGQGSRFAIPAARLGLGYGYSGIKRLADIVGTSAAMEIFYTARQLSAAEAYEMGLVNRVVAEAELDDFVTGYADRIRANAPLTIATVKAAALEIGRDPDARDLTRIDAMVETCFDSADYREGRTAFMEKRKPRFTGR
jgi:enoyl-CoA hydratase/carnithine racemase